MSQSPSLNYSTSDGSATSNTMQPDYNSTTVGMVSFSSGQTDAPIGIWMNDDFEHEGDETFQVNLTLWSMWGGTVVDLTAQGTILNDDPELEPLVITVSSPSAFENSGTLTFNIHREGGAIHDYLYLNSATSDGTAYTWQNDYGTTNSGVTFAPFQTDTTVSVSITDDDSVEENEIFYLNIVPYMGGSGVAFGVGTIMNDDAIISVAPATGSEKDGGMWFTVTRSGGDPSQFLYLSTSTDNGSAYAGQDFTSPSMGVYFQANQMSSTIWVPVTSDSEMESDETFTLNIQGNWSIIASATGTITDYTPYSLFQSSVSGPIMENHPYIDVTVSRSMTGRSQNVHVYTDSASANSTYSTFDSTIHFEQNETSKQIRIQLNDDLIIDGNQSFAVHTDSLDNTESVVYTDTSWITVIDDENSGTAILSTSASLTTEGYNSTIVSLTRTGNTDNQIAVHYQTSDGSAKSGKDYSAASGTAIFEAGQSTTWFQVNFIDDAIAEPDETFNYTITGLDGTQINTNFAIILDDDFIKVQDLTVNESAGIAKVHLVRSERMSETFTLHYSTAPGTASIDDFSAVSSSLTFSPNQTEAFVSIPITADNIGEPTEYFTFNAWSIYNNLYCTFNGQVMIENDDVESSPLHAFIGNGLGYEGGKVEFPIELSRPSKLPITISYSTIDTGFAVINTDYSVVNAGTITFQAGETEKLVSIDALNDSDSTEVPETFGLQTASTQLTSVIYDGTQTQALGTILDASDTTTPPMYRMSLGMRNGVNSGDYIENTELTLAPRAVLAGPFPSDHSFPIADYNQWSLTVNFNEALDSTHDKLFIRAGSPTPNSEVFTARTSESPSATVNVIANGRIIGTVTGGTNSDSLIVQFNTQASLATIRNVMQSIAFKSDTDAPLTSARHVDFTVKIGTQIIATKETSFGVTAIDDLPVIIAIQNRSSSIHA